MAPPAVTALRQTHAQSPGCMVRTPSIDIRAEREDLKQAAEQSLTVILDLGLDGIIRWVSPSWKDVVGTSVASIKGTPIADVLVSSKDVFSNAVVSMKKDDSRSQIIRFRVLMGPDSTLKRDSIRSETEGEEAGQEKESSSGDLNEEQILDLEAQGIMVYDRSSGGENHVSTQ